MIEPRPYRRVRSSETALCNPASAAASNSVAIAKASFIVLRVYRRFSVTTMNEILLFSRRFSKRQVDKVDAMDKVDWVTYGVWQGLQAAFHVIYSLVVAL